MTIAELSSKGKVLIEGLKREHLVLIILILSATASFGLGVLAGRDVGEGGAFSVTQVPQTASVLGSAPATLPAGGQVVASKTGAKYFLPWCGGAKLITDANKVWFANKEAAESKGYQPAANCKGL